MKALEWKSSLSTGTMAVSWCRYVSASLCTRAFDGSSVMNRWQSFVAIRVAVAGW